MAHSLDESFPSNSWQMRKNRNLHHHFIMAKCFSHFIGSRIELGERAKHKVNAGEHCEKVDKN